MANPTPAPPHEEHEAHVEHVTSWAPLVIALGIPFLYLAIVARHWGNGALTGTLVVGGSLLLWGIFWWMAEDMRRFRRAADVHAVGQPGPLLGVKLFIGTEVLIFGGIFAVWFVGKANHADLWSSATLPVVTTGINTVVLVASSGTLLWASAGLKKGNRSRYLLGLGLTILLGLVFLVNQLREYAALAGEGLTINSQQSGVFGSTFYMLTGTHGLHVAGGLFVLSLVFVRSLRKTQTAERHLFLQTADIYWHFVDVVWLFLYAVVYLRLL